MKLSRAAMLTSKERGFAEEILSQQIFFQSNLLKRYGAGIYGKHNFLVRAQAKIENIIREVLDKYDCVEVSLPLLQPQSIWLASGRWESYSSSEQMFYCNMSNGTFCLAPTAEEAVFEFIRENIKSYKSLPINIYQIGSKFRNELRVRGGLLRSKEFMMMDAYSFHATNDDLKREYENMKAAYLEIFSRLGLNVIPVKALNGDMGGNLSEEFMFIADAGEDTILVNEDRSIAFNKEILEMENATEYLKNNYGIDDISSFKELHCIELGHIFQLGQKYSISMNGTFKTSDDKDVPYYMGCYGIGVSRTLAAICEQNCDESGLIWDKNLAPYSLMIIYTEEKKDVAFALYDYLQSQNIQVVIDDRNNLRIGNKINDWKLFGLPYLIVVGNKQEGDTFEVESRKDGSKVEYSKEKIAEFLKT